MVGCYVLTQSDVHAWCMAIHEITAINEITTKSITFCSPAFLGCEIELTHPCSCIKAVSKISANFSNFDGVYFQKRISSTNDVCALKKNSARIAFLYCDINQFKTFLVHGNSFSIHGSWEIFPLINELMKEDNANA